MKFLTALFAAALVASPALSTTVTFDYDIIVEECCDPSVFQSQGFIFETSTTYPGYNDITLHDDGGAITSMIWRADGAAFTPKSIELYAFSRMFRTGETAPPDYDIDFDAFLAWTQAGVAKIPSLILTGFFASGATVTNTIMPQFVAPPSAPEVVLFGMEFAGISALSLTMLFPDTSAGQGLDGYQRHYEYTELTQPDTDWCFEYCAQFQADNLVVADPAPVPLPASGFLLVGTALGLIGLRRRRARPLQAGRSALS